MDAMFDKWDSILQNVAENHSSFLLFLSEELIHTLALNPAAESSGDTHAEGIFLWLDHLLTSPTWESQRPSLPRDYLLAVCNDHPSHWAKMLAKTLQLQLQDTAHAASGPQTTGNAASKKEAQNGSVKRLSKKLQEHGWGLADKWDSQPLGITSSK